MTELIEVEPVVATELVRFRDVSVVFKRGSRLRRRAEPVVALSSVSFSLSEGESLGVVGRTGAGKSTLANLVMGLTEPTEGTVEVFGHDLSDMSPKDRATVERKRQIVLQDPFSSVNPRMQVGEIVAEPLTLGRRAFSASTRDEIRGRVERALGMVGIPANRANLYPHQFSGGQLQRISIARALVSDPELVILDEPTSALDVSIRAQILTLLRELQTEFGLTYLVISHDLATVAYLSAMIAAMYQGRFVEYGPAQTLYQRPLHPYTINLVSSIPDASGEFLKLKDDETPSLVVPASGCPYVPSCRLWQSLGQPDLCLEVEPSLSDGDGHSVACHFSDESRSLYAADPSK